MSIRKYNTISPVIAAGAWVDEAAVVIGDVTIAADVSLWPMVVARGDVNWIRIGARTNVQDGSVLHVSHDSSFAPGGYPLSIGADPCPWSCGTPTETTPVHVAPVSGMVAPTRCGTRRLQQF